MPGPFAITAATNTVPLDVNRQGETSFTVSNTTGHPLRGRAHVEAQSAQVEPWLHPQGEAERDFASSGSQQYVVQIAVPQEAPTGDYTFRLNMVDVANPDDSFSDGPTVKFVVPAPPAPVKKPFPWWIVAVALGIVLLLGGTIYGLIRANAPKPPPPLPPPSWSNNTPLSAPRIYAAAATGPDGLIYVFGGKDNINNPPLSSMLAYDPKQKQWITTLPSMTTPRWGASAVTGSDGLIYVIGGLDANNQPLGTMEVYDPKAKAWVKQTFPSLATARWGFAAVKGSDGRIYVFGGLNTGNAGGTPTGTVEIYDPKVKANGWTPGPLPLPTPRWALSAALGPDHLIYVIGGASSGFTPVGTVEAYDPARGTWTTGLKPLPTARWALSATTGPDGLIYVTGGALATLQDSPVMEAYDPKTNNWAKLTQMTTARALQASVLGPDNRIYEIGGYVLNPPAGIMTVESYGVLQPKK